MHCIVQERDAAAQNAAKNFGQHQTQRGNHRPTEDGRLQHWVRVANVAAVIVDAMRMAMHVTSSAVNVIVGPRRHHSYSTRVAVASAVDGLRYVRVKSNL
jgi:hypothetical protein